MIKKTFALFLFFFLLSCSQIEFVVKENNQLKNKVNIITSENSDERFNRALYSFFGNNTNYEYILKTTFIEQKENRIVKKNQVAEKVDYTLEVNYELFYKNKNCEIFNKKIISRFSFTPKSFGYNFGADRSFEKLYNNTVRQNIEKFLEVVNIVTTCPQ